MIANEDEDEELRDARRLLEAIMRVEDFSLARGQPPEPDVIATSARDVIGVEVTRLNLGIALARREGEQLGVMSRARERFDAMHEERVVVHASWDDGILFTKSRRSALVARLIEEVVDMLREEQSTVTRCKHQAIAPPPRDPAFAYITVCRAPNLEHSGFALMLDWSHSTRGAHFLQEQIQRKESKPLNYRGTYAARCRGRRGSGPTNHSEG